MTAAFHGIQLMEVAMTKKDTKDGDKPKKYLGVGASGDVDNPAAGASAFGAVVEPEQDKPAPSVKDGEK